MTRLFSMTRALVARKRKIFALFFALAASIGMMNAKVTWNSSNISDLDVYGIYQSYSKEGVTLRANADMIDARWFDYGDESRSGIEFHANATGGFTFSNSLGKNFTKIEMTLRGPGGWDHANLGSGWSFSWEDNGEEPVFVVTWTGNAKTVDLAKDESSFFGDYVKRIVFYFEGDSEAPDPTYTIALEDGTANADKVTLSATSAVEGATVTVTPNDEYEITAFSAYYVVVNGQVGSINTIDATLNPETGAYSFKMPAYDVTIEATIAAKPVPEGDIFAGFTATAGSGGFTNEGHANLVDGKYISSDWTKWCTNNDYRSVPTGESGDACWWIDFEASAALDLTGYSLTTGNDAGSEHGRNPKNWVLKAKLNADDAWTTIATVTGDVTMKNQNFKEYKFFVDQSGSYKYFRFEVFANQGANVMQLCELRLIGTEASAPTPAGPIPCTAADLGKVLCTDGSIYATVSEATAAGKTAAAVIAYVDTQNGKALALALADDSDEMMDWATAKTTAAAHTPAVSNGIWALASKDDWNNMITAAGSYTALRDCFSSVGGTNMRSAWYWSSTSFSFYAWCYQFNNGEWFDDYQDGNNYVRACLAFDIPAAPAYETVMNLINEIPDPVVLTAECKAKIDAARTAYDALSDGDKAQVTNITTLTQAETDYAALNQAEADKVVAKIAAIPQPVTLKLATRDSIESARVAYEALNADQQALVSNYDVLTAAEATWAGLTNAAPAGALSGKYTINDGGDVIYFAHGNLQYTRENLDADWSTGTFRLAENQYDRIELVKTYPDAYCTDNYGDKTAVGLFGWGTWGEGKTPNLTSSDRTLYTWSTDFSGTLEGTSTWRTLTKDEWVYLLAHNNQSYATVHGVNGLLVAPDGKDIDGKSMENWVEINDETWTTMQNDGYLFLPACGQRSQISGANITTGGQGEEVLYYSSTQYNDTYAHNIWYKPGQAPAADDYSNKRQAFGVRLVTAGVNPLDQVQVVKGLIDAIPVPVTLDAACVNAIQSASAAYDALSDDAKAILDAADVKKMTDAEQALKDLNQAEADKVVAKINNIPTPVELKLATRDSIQNARAAYDALNAAQQTLVSNYQTLLDAEDALAALNPGGGMPAGALSGKFTINADGDQIMFSKGNLQATTTDLGEHWTWGFAANQWDLIGNAAANNAVNGNRTVSENGTVDLFGWSTPTTYYGIHNSTNSDYYSSDFREWGENITGAEWKTLNPSAWSYIISNRADAAQKQGQATVNGVNGYIFLPDEWELPTGLSFTAKPNNWTANVYDGDDWTAMENAGAVFLPKSPWRGGNTVTTLPAGYYWSSDYNNYSNAIAYNFREDASIKATGITRYAGIPVRLVTADAGRPTPLDSAQAVKDLIDAIPTPVEFPTSGAAIAAALNAYDALSDAAKGALDAADVQKLTDAAAAYEAARPFAPITTAPAAVAGLKYTGAAQALITAGEVEHGTLYYSLDGENWSEELPTAIPAGAYTVYYKVTATDDYKDVAPQTIAAAIAKVDIDFAMPKAVEGLVYTTKDQTLIAAGESEDGTFFYSLDNINWADALPKGLNAGTYSVYYKVQGDVNHNDYIAEEPITVTIAKAALTITAENKEIVYGFAAPGFSVSYYGLQGSDLPADVLTGELSYACDYTAGSNAGEYDITPSGQTSANYDITYVKGTLVVYKADPAFTEPVANTLTYNGGAQTLVAAGTTGHGTFEYTFTPNDEESWNTALPQAKNADTYGVYYRVVGDHNHLDYESADAVVVTIAKAALTATADDKSVIYGDDAPEYSYLYRRRVRHHSERHQQPELHDYLRQRQGNGKQGCSDHHRG